MIGTTLKYSSNQIRKTKNEDLFIICQSLIIHEFKVNFLLFWCLYRLVFYLETIGSCLNHPLMANICEKAISILVGNSNSGLSYLITIVQSRYTVSQREIQQIVNGFWVQKIRWF